MNVIYYSISLSEQELMLIRNVLGTRPHDEVRSLIDNLVRQVNTQQIEKAKSVTEPEPKPEPLNGRAKAK